MKEIINKLIKAVELSDKSQHLIINYHNTKNDDLSNTALISNYKNIKYLYCYIYKNFEEGFIKNERTFSDLFYKYLDKQDDFIEKTIIKNMYKGVSYLQIIESIDEIVIDKYYKSICKRTLEVLKTISFILYLVIKDLKLPNQENVIIDSFTTTITDEEFSLAREFINNALAKTITDEIIYSIDSLKQTESNNKHNCILCNKLYFENYLGDVLNIEIKT